MKKRSFKSLNLNKKSISNLEDLLKGGAIPTNHGCQNDTGCIGPVKETCGIINCALPAEK